MHYQISDKEGLPSLSDRKHNHPPPFPRLTCWCVREGGRVVAQLLPLLSAAVNPDAEAHEDDPAGSADACDESRLLHHVGDLLGQTHAAFFVAGATVTSVAWHGRLLGWRLCDSKQEAEREMKGSVPF